MVSVVMSSKAFKKSIALNSQGMSSSGGDNIEDKSVNGATAIAGDKGESYHTQDEPRRGDHSRDGSVEYIGTIKKQMRRVLPRLPDLTFLRLLGERV